MSFFEVIVISYRIDLFLFLIKFFSIRTGIELVFKEHAHRWGIVIVVLPGANRPQEGRQKACSYKYTEGNENEYDRHGS
jgi:hypothetical protein